MLTYSQQHLAREDPGKSRWTFRNAGNDDVSTVEVEGEEYEMSTERVGGLDVEDGRDKEDEPEEVF